jgi:Uma2 family endonuclease
MSNDSGVITQRDPDTLRGADVAYYSFDRLTREPLAKGYGPEVPELVVEVRSADDRWRDIQEMAVEYLKAGVLVVVVLDPERRSGHIFNVDEPPATLREDDKLTLPGMLEGFRVRLDRFFE